MAKNTESDVDVFDNNAVKENPPQAKWIQLEPTELLSIEQADALLRWRPAQVVAIIGEHKSGKTTLALSIYDRLLKGPFAGCEFVYSQTLTGFERMSFESRIESGEEEPDTKRTSVQDGLKFFHISLAHQVELDSHFDLLISERAGETYRAARDFPTKSLDLIEVMKAKNVVFVVDGAQVANALTRSNAFAAVRGTIRSFLDGKALSSSSVVQVVTSKMDKISPTDTAAFEAIDAFEHGLTSQFSNKLKNLSFFRVIARDPTGKHEIGSGVDEILKDWLRPVVPRPSSPLAVPELKSEFDRLLTRTATDGRQ